MKLILSITTFNRLDYLKECLSTWEQTKNNSHQWKVIIADDGSTDGTIEFVSGKYDLIRNNMTGVHSQTNDIIKRLEGEDFDVCFKVDDDIFFKMLGWDDLYLSAIEESGYDHLVFLDNSRKAFSDKIAIGKIESNTDFVHVLGCFFTITPSVISKVGYFDLLNFGKQESGHIDYTYRCCRAGFNDVNNPFDALGSNEFIGLHWQHTDFNYRNSLPESERESRRSIYDPLTHLDNFLFLNRRRIYVPQHVPFY